MYKCLCGCKFSFLLGRYLGMKLLSHMALIVEHLRNCEAVFKAAALFYILTSSL